MRAETASAVTDAAKQVALDKRRSLAATTKSDKANWEEHAKNNADHLKAAKANRAAAEASRAKAKMLREKITAQRQKEASATREAQKRNKLAKDQQILEAGQATKQVHDSIYRAKYVPQESAEMLEKSKYGKALTESPNAALRSERSGETGTPPLGEREKSRSSPSPTLELR